MGTDGECAYLRVTAAIDTLEPRSFVIRLPNSAPSEATWFFGTLPLFLASDESTILGRTCTYTAAFLDSGKEADAEVSVLLVDNN